LAAALVDPEPSSRAGCGAGSHQLRGCRHHFLDRLARQRLDGAEWMHARHEQRLVLVDVADAGESPVDRAAPRRSTDRVVVRSANRLLRIEVRGEQVGTEVAKRRASLEVRAVVNSATGTSNATASITPVSMTMRIWWRGRCHARPAIDVPRTVHAHVRAQHEIAGEVD
jgi:hypothetical protein